MCRTGITIYGAYWCRDCRRTKQFLGEQQIPYGRVDIEEDKAVRRMSLARRGQPEGSCNCSINH